MARTKATARRKGSGPNLAVAGAPSKVKSKSSKKGKPMRMLQRNQRRRINQGSNVLREIRKAQKAVGFAMTMAPFQRLVREICDCWDISHILIWCCSVLKRLFDALDLCPPNSNLLNLIEPIALQTPQQTDAYSCGWRLLITAKYMLDSYFGEKQPKFMQEDSFGSDYVYSFRANTILMLLRHASPIPTTPPLLKVITEQRDLKSLNVDANILDGFQKDSKHHSKVPKEIEMEDEPRPRNMESSDVTEERKEKPRESQGNKKPLSESLGRSQKARIPDIGKFVDL